MPNPPLTTHELTRLPRRGETWRAPTTKRHRCCRCRRHVATGLATTALVRRARRPGAANVHVRRHRSSSSIYRRPRTRALVSGHWSQHQRSIMATAEQLSLRVFLPCFLLVAICVRPPLSRAAARASDTVSRDQPLSGGHRLVSKGGKFAVGFFQPGTLNIRFVIHFQNLVVLAMRGIQIFLRYYYLVSLKT